LGIDLLLLVVFLFFVVVFAAAAVVVVVVVVKICDDPLDENRSAARTSTYTNRHTHTHTQKESTHTSMPRVEFGHTSSNFGQQKTANASFVIRNSIASWLHGIFIFFPKIAKCGC
jgi:hypothetical protein